MRFHQHQPCPPPIRSIASDQIGYRQRYLIAMRRYSGVNSLGMELTYMPRRFRLERRFFILKSRRILKYLLDPRIPVMNVHAGRLGIREVDHKLELSWLNSWPATLAVYFRGTLPVRPRWHSSYSVE